MNICHSWICRSNHWRKTLDQRIPWVLAEANLGAEPLEIGPGPGLTTEALSHRFTRLTALEIDPAASDALRARLRSTKVEVVTGDAASMPFPDQRFSGAVMFTMLHHVPSPELQDQVLREVWRVLKPGGIFVGSDSTRSLLMRVIHIGDTTFPWIPADSRTVLLRQASRFARSREMLTHSDFGLDGRSDEERRGRNHARTRQ